MKAPLLAAALLCALGLPAPAQTILLALSKQDHTLSVIDPSTLKILYTLPVGPDPHEVTASTDGTTAFVSNYGLGSLHTIAVLDLHTLTVTSHINAGPEPDGLAWSTHP